jgi:hypothetical protein
VCGVFFAGRLETAQGLKPNLISIVYGPTKELAEKVGEKENEPPQRVKPDSLQSTHVRPEGRTLQKHEFFRKLLKPQILLNLNGPTKVVSVPPWLAEDLTLLIWNKTED